MISSIRFRLFWLQRGVFFLKSSSFRVRSVRVNGRRIRLAHPPGEAAEMDHEFKQIVYDDCYGLRRAGGRIARIVDVGANIGLFSIAAKMAFPAAGVQCYEPNPDLHPILHSHLDPLGVEIFGEAVGAAEGTVNLRFGNGSLHTRTEDSENGLTRRSSMRTVLERAGGNIDLLKLDCEGAEWEILDNPEWAGKVRHIVMEYHLWARPESSILDLVAILHELGFRVTHLHENEKLEWGLLHATSNPQR